MDRTELAREIYNVLRFKGDFFLKPIESINKKAANRCRLRGNLR